MACGSHTLCLITTDWTITGGEISGRREADMCGHYPIYEPIGALDRYDEARSPYVGVLGTGKNPLERNRSTTTALSAAGSGHPLLRL